MYFTSYTVYTNTFILTIWSFNFCYLCRLYNSHVTLSNCFLCKYISICLYQVTTSVSFLILCELYYIYCTLWILFCSHFELFLVFLIKISVLLIVYIFMIHIFSHLSFKIHLYISYNVYVVQSHKAFHCMWCGVDIQITFEFGFEFESTLVLHHRHWQTHFPLVNPWTSTLKQTRGVCFYARDLISFVSSGNKSEQKEDEFWCGSNTLV